MMYYRWQENDDKWTIAGRHLLRSGWPDTVTFVLQIEAFNLAAYGIYDWQAVTQGTLIVLPFSTSINS